MKVLVPLANHSFLTEAHTEIINYAKTLGDVAVSITVGLREWNYWLREGKKFGLDPAFGYRKRIDDASKVDIKKQVEQVKALGIPKVEAVYPSFNEARRKYALPIATKFMNLYRDQIISKRWYDSCLSTLMRNIVGEPPMKSIEGVEAILRGIEVQSFFSQHHRKLFEWIDCIIYPNIVRDKLLGIRGQFTLKFVDPSCREQLAEIRPVFLSVKNRLVPRNDNLDIIEELNYSYRSRAWKIIDAIAIEGGIVPGRLVGIGVVVPAREGTIYVEDIDYEPH